MNNHKEIDKSESEAAVRGGENVRGIFEIGSQDKGIIARQPGLLMSGQGSFLPGLPTAAWRWTSYKHSWKTVLGHNESHLHWAGFAVDERDGSKITWDRVEIGAHAHPGPIASSDIGQQEFYRHYDNIADLNLGWDKEGKDPDFVSAAKCWLGTYWFFWSWHSHA